MRIEFLTEDDPIYLLPFFDEFFRHFSSEFEIQQVSLCRVMGKRPRGKLARDLIALYGLPGFVRLASYAVLAKFLGKFSKPPRAARYHGMAQLCRAYSIPFEHVENPNAPTFIEGIRRRKSELLVSVACPYILKSEVLNAPPRGCINIHHAPLPRYKGMMPTFWQLYHGEKTVGVTVHYMAEKVDEGNALYQTSLEVKPGESLHELICRSKRHGAHCVAQVIRALQDGEARTFKLDQSTSSYFTFPTLGEIREFHHRGLRGI